MRLSLLSSPLLSSPVILVLLIFWFSDGAVRAQPNYDTDASLRQPEVHTELQKLVGREFEHLMHNLNVRGTVDLSGQTLSVNGNPPHQGTEEEAIVCVTVLPLKTIVEAAILSMETVTAYTRAGKYEHASISIKDWITLANSRHADRFEQPSNVRVVSPAR